MSDQNILHKAPLSFANDKQKKLFDQLFKLAPLTITIEQNGIYSHLVGCFAVNSHDKYGTENRIDLVGSDSHIHVEWEQLNYCDISVADGEGVISFFKDKNLLLKIYHMQGEFPPEIQSFTGSLIDSP